MIKFNITKEELEKLILKEKLSYEEIGRAYNVSGNCVKKKAKKLGIVLQRKRKVNPEESFGKGIKRFTKLDSFSDKDFIEIITNNHSWKDITNKLGYKSIKDSKIVNRIRERCNSLDITISFKRSNFSVDKDLVYSISIDKFKKIIEESLSLAEVSRKVGVSIRSGYNYIKDRINKENIDTSHFTGKAWNTGDRYRSIENSRKIPTKDL